MGIYTRLLVLASALVCFQEPYAWVDARGARGGHGDRRQRRAASLWDTYGGTGIIDHENVMCMLHHEVCCFGQKGYDLGATKVFAFDALGNPMFGGKALNDTFDAPHATVFKIIPQAEGVKIEPQDKVVMWSHYRGSIAAGPSAVQLQLIQAMQHIACHRALDEGRPFYGEIWNLPLSNFTRKDIPSDQYPDMVTVREDMMQELTANGMTSDLTKWMEVDFATGTDISFDVPTGFLQTFRSERGRWLARPFVSNYRVLLFNMTTFNASGLDFPPPWGKMSIDEWDWATFMQYAQTIKQKTGYPGFIFDPASLSEMELLSLVGRSFGVLPITPRLNNTELYQCNLDSNQYVRAIDEVIRPMFTSDYIDPDWYPAQSKSFQAWEKAYPGVNPWVPPFSFYNNLEHSHTEGGDPAKEFSKLFGMALTTEAPFDWAMHREISYAVIPNGITVGTSVGIAITSKAKNPTLAWNVASMCTSKSDGMDYVVQVNFDMDVLPPYKSMWNSGRFDSGWEADRMQFKNVLSFTYPYPTPPEMQSVLEANPFRTMLHMIRRNSSTQAAVGTTCLVVGMQLLPECTAANIVANMSAPCNPATDLKPITFSWQKDHQCKNPLKLPDTLYVSCDHIGGQSGLAKILYSVGGVGIVLVVSMSVAVFVYRDAKAIKSASVFYSQLMLLGGLMVLVGVVLLPGEPSPSREIAQTWLVFLGDTIIFASIAVKLYRISKIFFNGKAARFRMTDRHLLAPWAMLVGPQVGLLLVFTFLAPISLTTITTSAVYRYNGQPHFLDNIPLPATTTGNSAIYFCCIAYVNILVIMAAIYAFRIRHVPTHFKETKMIITASIQMVLMVLVLIPVQALVTAHITRDTIYGATWCASVLLLECIIFLPKMLHVIELVHLSSFSGSSGDPSSNNRKVSRSRDMNNRNSSGDSTSGTEKTETRSGVDSAAYKKMQEELAAMSAKLAKATEANMRLANMHAGLAYSQGAGATVDLVPPAAMTSTTSLDLPAAATASGLSASTFELFSGNGKSEAA